MITQTLKEARQKTKKLAESVTVDSIYINGCEKSNPQPRSCKSLSMERAHRARVALSLANKRLGQAISKRNKAECVFIKRSELANLFQISKNTAQKILEEYAIPLRGTHNGKAFGVGYILTGKANKTKKEEAYFNKVVNTCFSDSGRDVALGDKYRKKLDSACFQHPLLKHSSRCCPCNFIYTYSKYIENNNSLLFFRLIQNPDLIAFHKFLVFMLHAKVRGLLTYDPSDCVQFVDFLDREVDGYNLWQETGYALFAARGNVDTGTTKFRLARRLGRAAFRVDGRTKKSKRIVSDKVSFVPKNINSKVTNLIKRYLSRLPVFIRENINNSPFKWKMITVARTAFLSSLKDLAPIYRKFKRSFWELIDRCWDRVFRECKEMLRARIKHTIDGYKNFKTYGTSRFGSEYVTKRDDEHYARQLTTSVDAKNPTFVRDFSWISQYLRCPDQEI